MTKWGIALEAMRRRRPGNGDDGELAKQELALRGKIAQNEYWRIVTGGKAKNKSSKKGRTNGPTFVKLTKAIHGIGGTFTEFGQFMDDVINGHLTEKDLAKIRPPSLTPAEPTPARHPVGLSSPEGA